MRTTCSIIVAVATCGAMSTGCGSSDEAGPQDGDVVATSAPEGAASAGRERRPAGVLVDIAGRVRRPGVYELARDARVHEAIAAAGGASAGADLAALNRAAPVVDGQQIVVPARGAAADGGGGHAGEGPAGSAVAVSINAATEAQLDELPGVGPVTAAHIVAERTSGGPFRSVDDLERVPGVGPATIEALRDLVTV